MKEYDFIVIGSGFGGSVSAMRLAQKGYSVAIIEKGKRYRPQDFAKTNWQIRKFLWAPLIKCFGIQQISLLKGVMVLHGAGVGGGSLVYANTLMRPTDDVLRANSWPQNIDWLAELKPHYDTAEKMLGVTTNRHETEAENILRQLGYELGCEKTFHLTEVGVYFGAPGDKVSDPYFSGQGPDRVGCTACGACMVGCRDVGKNSLDKNYLYFAEKWGAQIFSELKVEKIIPQDGGYAVETRSVHQNFFAKRRIFRGKKVIVSSGVLGSVDLLLRNRDIHNTLPLISKTLGDHIKTNGESLCGVTSLSDAKDLSRGIAIGSAIHPDAVTKIEAVRYNSGSSLMKLLAVPLTENGNRLIRPLKLMVRSILRLPRLLKLWTVRDWARQTVILLVMQSVDFHMQLRLRRNWFGRKSLQGEAEAKKWPSYLPIAQTATKKLARIMNGVPQNAFSEVLLGTPATAHILGGCAIGESSADGVIDSNHEVFSHPGLYVCDGSVIPANLGVNPSLTITALAERFASQFVIKNKSLFSQRQILFSSKSHSHQTSK